MPFQEFWEVFVATPQGTIVLGLFAFALYMGYVAIKNHFSERREERILRAKESEKDAKDDESSQGVLQSMLTALTTTIANQTDTVKAIKEQADAVRALSEATSGMQFSLVDSLKGLSSALGAAMKDHDEQAVGRQKEIIQRVDDLDTSMRRMMQELIALRAASDKERNQRFDDLSLTMTGVLEELHALVTQLAITPDPTSDLEA